MKPDYYGWNSILCNERFDIELNIEPKTFEIMITNSDFRGMINIFRHIMSNRESQ